MGSVQAGGSSVRLSPACSVPFVCDRFSYVSLLSNKIHKYLYIFVSMLA